MGAKAPNPYDPKKHGPRYDGPCSPAPPRPHESTEEYMVRINGVMINGSIYQRAYLDWLSRTGRTIRV